VSENEGCTFNALLGHLGPSALGSRYVMITPRIAVCCGVSSSFWEAFREVSRGLRAELCDRSLYPASRLPSPEIKPVIEERAESLLLNFNTQPQSRLYWQPVRLYTGKLRSFRAFPDREGKDSVLRFDEDGKQISGRELVTKAQGD
jgi:hypothetical protein